MRKIVAVLGYGKKRQESTFTYPVDTINAGYASSIIKAGALPFLVPSTKDPDIIRSTVQKVDGILIPGGNDIDPFLYGESVTFADKYDRENDYFQLCMLEEAIKEGKPVMGICRGMQIINVFFGGTLYQDIEKERPQSLQHSAPGSPEGFIHPVCIEKTSLLYDIFDKKEIMVNSIHHQGVRKPGDGLFPAAHSPDGIIEALENREHNIIAVQWHPEALLMRGEENSMRLFSLFTSFLEKQ